jgi:signal recognition particle subunit SRP54
LEFKKRISSIFLVSSMFENLQERLQDVFSRLKSRGHLTEKDVKIALREIRMALLEADVNFKVVKNFIGKIEERAVGDEVLGSLTPGQQVVKIVNEELIELMGGAKSDLIFAGKPPTVLMLVGLQGSGKTTATAKLGHFLKHQGKRPFLVAADVYRPAAIEQLKTLGAELGAPVYSAGDNTSPVEIVRQGIKEAIAQSCDVAVLDTAGRLHIDEEMMAELSEIKQAVRPQQILLVVDAMSGQDAVNVAVSFQEKVGIDGVILTKLDGDARGGAALSISAVTGKPIKLVSIGEKLDSLQPFYPDRMASRILGMGDVLGFIEKAQEAVEEEQAQALEEKIRKQSFTLEDFLQYMGQLEKMGPLNQIIKMLPGIPGMPGLKHAQMDESVVGRLKAIIQSMTIAERRDPTIINGSRRTRIARGSGTSTQDVNQLLKQFKETQKLVKQLGKFGQGRSKKGLFTRFK